MDEDEDDFFAYQAVKSLNNRKLQIKRFLQAPVTCPLSSSTSNSESDDENDLISNTKSRASPTNFTVQSVAIPTQTVRNEDLIKNEIDAIVTSCLTQAKKEVKRKIPLGKRTAADDKAYEDEDQYLTRTNRTKRRGQGRREQMDSFDRSHLEEDDEKVTRETAAYDRLNAVLRVTKPLCEKQIELSDDDSFDDKHDSPIKSDIPKSSNELNVAQASSCETIALKIDHCDGRHVTLSVESSLTLKSLCELVAERLQLPAIYLVYNNRTLKLDDTNQSSTLKQLEFSSNSIQLLESYPLVRKLKIFIQTSSSFAGRRSSLASKREYMLAVTDKFETIFEAYKRDMKSSNIRFEFDGDTLHPRARPIDYDMIDGEILDAFILPTSAESNVHKNPILANRNAEIISETDSDN